MERSDGRLSQLARRVVEPLGYELVAVELVQRGGSGATLRIYIDHPEGIGLDDCEDVSEQLSAVLDVEDPLQGRYDLEVSSPGLDRPLVDAAHFRRFQGERATVRLGEKIEGRRRLEGVIAGCEDGILSLDADGRRWLIPMDRIEIARLVPIL
jgi:ribosome maturation factor RimP